MNYFLRPLSANSSLRSPQKKCVTTMLSPRAMSLNARRQFSAAQAATALRPFYFAVHPDLFGRYPDIRTTNENSLKLFNGYLDGLYGRTTAERPVKSVQLKFYVRSKHATTSPATSATGSHNLQQAFRFTSVDVHLNDDDPYTAVRHVLESCNLPTEHLPPPTFKAETANTFANNDYLRQFWQRKNVKDEKSSLAFQQRLKKLNSKADELRRRHGFYEAELRKTIERLKSTCGLRDIQWQAGWTLSHCKGCLQTLNRLLETYRIPATTLNGWSVKFGRGIYVSLDGCIVLGVDDVPEDWCKVLLNLSPKDQYFNDLSDLEKSLSSLLNNAQISGWPDESLVVYKSWLKSIIGKFQNDKSIGDRYASAAGSWQNLRVILVNNSTGLSVNAEGKILMPASTSLENMWKFIIDNHEEAEMRRNTYHRLSAELEQLKLVCVQNLNLMDLSWDNVLNLELVKGCINRITKSAEFKLLSGQKVYLSRSYSVLPDGTISIPVDC